MKQCAAEIGSIKDTFETEGGIHKFLLMGTVGGSCTFHAKISGKHLEADSIRWYANGVEAASAAGQSSVTVPITAEMQGTTFKVYAVVSYNGSTVTSNCLLYTS